MSGVSAMNNPMISELYSGYEDFHVSKTQPSRHGQAIFDDANFECIVLHQTLASDYRNKRYDYDDDDENDGYAGITPNKFYYPSKHIKRFNGNGHNGPNTDDDDTSCFQMNSSAIFPIIVLIVLLVIALFIYWEIRDVVTTTAISADEKLENEFVYVTDFGEGHTLAPDVNE